MINRVPPRSASPSSTVTWLHFFRTSVARPLAPGRDLFRVGPSSTLIEAINSFSAPRFLLRALLLAERISFEAQGHTRYKIVGQPKALKRVLIEGATFIVTVDNDYCWSFFVAW